MSVFLTHYEITKQLASARKAVETATYHHQSAVTKWEASTRRLEASVEKNQKHMAKAERMARLPQGDKKRETFQKTAASNRADVAYRTYMVGMWNQMIATNERDLGKKRAEVERIEAMYGLYLVPLSSQVSERVVVTVRLFSGEMLDIEVDRAHPVGGFADQFAQQHGYQPSATERMVFLLPASEAEEKEEANTLFWSPEVRHNGKSIGDILGDREPLVHLLIRSVEESEREEKVPTLRAILTSLHRNDRLSDEALYDMYANWRLTADVSSLRNRYQRMLAFVEAHPEEFPVLSEAEQAEQARRVDLRGFREFLRKTTYQHPSYRIQDMRQVVQTMLVRKGQDTVFCPNLIKHFLSVLTVEELFEAGIRVQNISPQFKYYRYLAEWDRYTAEAAAEEA